VSRCAITGLLTREPSDGDKIATWISGKSWLEQNGASRAPAKERNSAISADVYSESRDAFRRAAATRLESAARVRASSAASLRSDARRRTASERAERT
jgi:hypothetical protein